MNKYNDPMRNFSTETNMCLLVNYFISLAEIVAVWYSRPSSSHSTVIIGAVS